MNTTRPIRNRVTAGLAGVMLLGLVQPGLAQEQIVPTRSAAQASAPATPLVDLGERAAVPSTLEAAAPASGGVPTKTAAATKGKAKPPATAAPVAPDPRIERVTFQRRPVRVALPVGRERLVSFSGPVAFHAPEGYENTMSVQIVGATAYVTALSPFGTFRVIAEDLENTGVQIPIDFVADRTTAAASDEIEIHTVSARSGAAASGSSAGPASDGADMVTLTRHAAQQLYAPRRLLPANPAIRQVAVATSPVPGLYRGARVVTTPLGAWRAGSLYVTAVRFTNLEKTGVELEMSELRGQWLAATPQHGRLAAAGSSEADTTAVYLVCNRPFEACR